MMRRVIVTALAMTISGGPLSAQQNPCTPTIVGLAPSTYVRSALLTSDMQAAAQNVVLRDSAGTPNPAGKICMLLIGMSNARYVGTRLINLMLADQQRRSGFIFVNGAKPDMVAVNWSDPNSAAWTYALNQALAVGCSVPQIQLIHVVMTQKDANLIGPMSEAQIRAIVDIAIVKFPSLAFGYLSGIAYVGYGVETYVQEPFVHDESILLGNLAAAGNFPIPMDFLDQWSDASTVNPLTGLRAFCGDYMADGIHPVDPNGRYKLAISLWDRWRADPVMVPLILNP